MRTRAPLIRTGIVLLLSLASPGNAAELHWSLKPSGKEFENHVSAHVTEKGYRLDGQAITQELASFRPFETHMKEGRCYILVVRLTNGVTSLSERAQEGIELVRRRRTPKGLESKSSTSAHGPGFLATAGCGWSAPEEVVTWDLVVSGEHAAREVHDLGQGTVDIRLYSKPAEPTPIPTKSEIEAARKASDRFRKEQHERTCTKCRQDLVGCQAGLFRVPEGRCDVFFQTCLESVLGPGAKCP